MRTETTETAEVTRVPFPGWALAIAPPTAINEINLSASRRPSITG